VREHYSATKMAQRAAEVYSILTIKPLQAGQSG